MHQMEKYEGLITILIYKILETYRRIYGHITYMISFHEPTSTQKNHTHFS